MAYKLRLVQKFQESKKKEFLALEKRFIQLETADSYFPKGKRYLTYSGREALNTLIWECEFTNIGEVHQALEYMQNNTGHEELFAQQVNYFCESYTEIYQSLGE
jgi:hypothetical protein